MSSFSSADASALPDSADALLEIARRAGMLVMLDAQIGQQRYHSVAGSVASLTRFANALCEAMRSGCAAA